MREYPFGPSLVVSAMPMWPRPSTSTHTSSRAPMPTRPGCSPGYWSHRMANGTDDTTTRPPSALDGSTALMSPAPPRLPIGSGPLVRRRQSRARSPGCAGTWQRHQNRLDMSRRELGSASHRRASMRPCPRSRRGSGIHQPVLPSNGLRVDRLVGKVAASRTASTTGSSPRDTWRSSWMVAERRVALSYNAFTIGP